MVGVQEEIQRLSKRVEEAEQVINGVPELNYQIDRLEVSELYFSLLSIFSAIILFLTL